MMAVLECPTRNDLPSYSYVIALDGVNFTLTFTYNDRMTKWFLDLADQNGISVVNQVPVVVTVGLFDRFLSQAIPSGTLVAYDTSGKNIDPGRFDLGDRVRLMYIEAGTL